MFAIYRANALTSTALLQYYSDFAFSTGPAYAVIFLFYLASSLPSPDKKKQEFQDQPPKSSTIATADLKNKTKVPQQTSPTTNKPFKKKMQTANKQRKLTSTDEDDDEKV